VLYGVEPRKAQPSRRRRRRRCLGEQSDTVNKKPVETPSISISDGGIDHDINNNKREQNKKTTPTHNKTWPTGSSRGCHRD